MRGIPNDTDIEGGYKALVELIKDRGKGRLYGTEATSSGRVGPTKTKLLDWAIEVCVHLVNF